MKTSRQDRLEDYRKLNTQSCNGMMFKVEDIEKYVKLRQEFANPRDFESKTVESA